MKFRYVQNPHNSSAIQYSEKPQKCAICHQSRPGYEGIYHYDYNEPIFVCEECILNGKFQEKEGRTNEGSPRTLRKQMRKLNPQMSEEELENIVRQKTDEIEYRTPHITTWQDFTWPVHCGDYCCYIGEAGKSELNTFAPDGDGKVFLRSLSEWMGEIGGEEDRNEYRKLEGEMDIDWLWDKIPAHAPKTKSDPCSWLHLFKCLHCHKYIVLIDMD